MLDDLTILIPTFERPRHLRRLLSYYESLSVHVLIGDSSLHPFPAGELPSNAMYFHYPEVDFEEKMIQFVANAETTYSVLCPDDDFLTPSGLARCLEFLKENPDYSSAQGRAISFLPQGRFAFHAIYLHAVDYAIDAETASERFCQMMSLYVQQFYAVQRTDTIRDAFGVSGGYLNTAFSEVVLCAFGAMRGKHRVLPILYCAREQGETPADRKTISQTFEDSEYRDDLKRFSKTIVPELMVQDGITAAEGVKVVGNALLDYLAFDVDWYTGGYQTLESARERWVKRRKDCDSRMSVKQLKEEFNRLSKQGDPSHDKDALAELSMIARLVEETQALPTPGCKS